MMHPPEETFPAHPLPGDLRFRLRNTGDSSARLGPCEVCGLHCSEVYLQATLQAYEAPELEGGLGWSYLPGPDFGHRACLVASRNPNAEIFSHTA